MSMQERARMIRSDVNEKRLTHGLDKTQRERDRLEAENEVLRGRMAHADQEREHLLHSVDELSGRRPSDKPRKHRLRRLMVLGAAAGSAYVFGAKAGRERYEEIRERWSALRDRIGRDRDTASMDYEPPASEIEASTDR
jgi:hypothetical protein